MITHASEDALHVRRRPPTERRRQRSTHVAMPVAWAALVVERCGLGKDVAWTSWQALASSRWSAATALRQQFLLFPLCPETGEALARCGITPRRLVYALESLLVEGLLSPSEAAHLEEAILAQTTKVGTWKEKSYEI